jgi:hypothetical protein
MKQFVCEDRRCDAAKTRGHDYDVSYSDPRLPFSIFVGINSGDQANGKLRLAEGISHSFRTLR